MPVLRFENVKTWYVNVGAAILPPAPERAESFPIKPSTPKPGTTASPPGKLAGRSPD